MDDVIGQRAYNKLDAGRQCTAMSKQTGARCKRAPIVGGFVCDLHGGKIPAVQKSARERLQEMVDPALAALLRALRTAPPCEHCGRSDADRDPVVLRAAQLVLDRAGFHPTLTVEQAAPPNKFANLNIDELIAQLETMLADAIAQRDTERARLLPEAEDGFVVPEDEESVWSIPPGDLTKEPAND
jgi:hypothetical protein